MSTLQHAAPSTLCIDMYRRNIGSDLDAVAPNTVPTITISHPTLRLTWKTDGDIIRLTTGKPMEIELDLRQDTYSSGNGFIALKDNNNGGKYVRHTGFTMYTHPFAMNNFDFAWFFQYNSQQDDYIIYNDYGGGHVVGYDQNADVVKIVENNSPMVVRWKIANLSGSKSKLKAISMMRLAQGQAEGTSFFDNVDACILPPETLPTFDITSPSCQTTYGLMNMKKTIPGNLSADTNRQQSQVNNGTGIYPTSGCSFTTSDPNMFTQTINATAQQIEQSNERNLKQLQQECTLLFTTSQNLDKQIAQVTSERDQAINNFSSYLTECRVNRQTSLTLTGQLNKLQSDCKSKKAAAEAARQAAARQAAARRAAEAARQEEARLKAAENTLIRSDTRPNYCLDVYAWNKSTGAQTVAWDCHGGTNQQWSIDNLGRIKSVHSDKCLNVWGASTHAGAEVKMHPCTDWALNDKWFIDNQRRLHPQHAPHMCLDVWTGSGRNGDRMTIHPCHNGPNQKWSINQNFAAPPEKSMFAPSSEPVVFFEHCNYTGRRSEIRQPGEYHLQDMGINNDMISSIKIPLGYQVTVFEHWKFEGASKTFSADVPCLVDHNLRGRTNWNDQTSSFKIEWIPPIRISHSQTNQSWKLDGTTLRLNRGNDMVMLMDQRKDTYKSNNNFFALRNVSNGLYVRHTGFVMYTHPFVNNNFDFAWIFQPVGPNLYVIYNDYGGGYVVGYDSSRDVILILPRGNAAATVWKIEMVR
jgi:hypothetical protein